jgi:cell division transport system permease protein
MTFLCVFALALSLASGRLASRWSDALARTATIRLSAPPEQVDVQTEAILALLATTPGIASARALSDDEARALLEPWFGPDLPLEALPIPRLIEVVEADPGYDGEGLRQAGRRGAGRRAGRPHPLAPPPGRGGGPAAPLGLAVDRADRRDDGGDDHAGRQCRAGRQCAGGAGAAAGRRARTATSPAPSCAASPCARWRVGRRGGAGLIGVALLPRADAAGGFLTGLGFTGFGWLWPFVLPPLAGAWPLPPPAAPPFASSGAAMIVLQWLRSDLHRRCICRWRLWPWSSCPGRSCRKGARWRRTPIAAGSAFPLRLICGLRSEVRGTPPTGEVVVAAKHQSFFDIILIYSTRCRGRSS